MSGFYDAAQQHGNNFGGNCNAWGPSQVAVPIPVDQPNYGAAWKRNSNNVSVPQQGAADQPVTRKRGYGSDGNDGWTHNNQIEPKRRCSHGVVIQTMTVPMTRTDSRASPGSGRDCGARIHPGCELCCYGRRLLSGGMDGWMDGQFER
eukprot:Selendium_serpulae@DN4106_c0_g1_i1.p1